MNTLLQIHTSLNGANSLSSSLAGEYVTAWQDNNPGGRVITRDLATDPVPHLTAARFAAFLSDDAARGNASANSAYLLPDILRRNRP